MSTLEELCSELIADRANSADIPLHCTQIIDRIDALLNEWRRQAAQAKTQRETRHAIGGWAFPTFNARKCHYFPGGQDRSLCTRYALYDDSRRPSAPVMKYVPSPDDCKACLDKVMAKLTDYYPEGMDS